MKLKIRTGFGYDVHQLQEGLDFWLGGIGVWFEVKPAWDAMDEAGLERMVMKAPQWRARPIVRCTCRWAGWL